MTNENDVTGLEAAVIALYVQGKYVGYSPLYEYIADNLRTPRGGPRHRHASVDNALCRALKKLRAKAGRIILNGGPKMVSHRVKSGSAGCGVNLHKTGVLVQLNDGDSQARVVMSPDEAVFFATELLKHAQTVRDDANKGKKS